MQPTPSAQRESVRIVAALFASAGLGVVLAFVFCAVAGSFGLLFSGISTVSTTLIAVAVCTVGTTVTALVLRRRQRFFGWRELLIEVSVLALVAVAVTSWLDTRQQLRIFIAPSPVPSGLRVHQGRSILFSSYVHFTAPPAVIASLLQSKGLVEIPAEPPEGSDWTGYGARQETKKSWDWWQPGGMSNASFFFLHHKSLAVQGWSEGWWVNGATNEVYAFIGG